MTHNHSAAPPLFTLLFGFLFLAAGICAVAIFSQTNTLTCTRIEPALIRCTRQAALFGLLTLDETEFRNITGAVLGESCDTDDCAYRVELLTSEGVTPLNMVYYSGNSGQSSQQSKVERINTFVADETAVTIVITDTTSEKALAFLPLLFVLFGLFMSGKGARDFITNYRAA